MAGTRKSQSRWRGVGPAGFCKMAPYNTAVPATVLAEVTAREKDLVSGKRKVFAGPISDRDDKVRVAAGALLPNANVRGKNWVVDGVKGAFPKT